MHSNFKLTGSKSFDPHEEHSNSVLQHVSRFVFRSLFTPISFPRINSINIKDASNSMAITNMLHIIINTEHCSNKYITGTILNSHPKTIKNIIKIVNCSSSGVILNLEISNHRVLSILELKQDVELIPQYHQPVLDPIKSQIQLLCNLYNDSFYELKEKYISSPFARQYFTKICNSYKFGKNSVKCKVKIFPEELAGNNVVNLLKIIIKCKGNNDIIEKVRDYAKECTIKITEKELAAAFTTLAVYQLADINDEALTRHA